MLLSQVPYGDVMGKTLVFAVFDFDRFSKNDEIGEVDKINIFQSLSSTWIKHHVRLHWRRKMCKNSAKNRVKHNWYRHCRFGNSRGNDPFLQHYTKMVRHSRWREALNGSQWLWSETLLQSLKMIIMPIIMIVITILIIMIVKVRLPVCNIDLAYTEEMWGEIKDTKGDGHVKKIIIMSCQHIPIITKSRHGHHHHHHHHHHRVIIIVKIIIIIITILPLYCWCMWLAEVLIMTKRNHLEYTHTQFGGDDDHHMRNDDDR